MGTTFRKGSIWLRHSHELKTNYKSSLPKLKETVDSPSSKSALRGKDVLGDTELMGRRPLQGTEGPRCPGSPLLDGARQSGNTLAHRWSHSLRGHRQAIAMICAKSVHDPFHYSFIIF